jgi:diadenylate cyclase
MEDLLYLVRQVQAELGLASVIDILLVSGVVYTVLYVIRGTQAVQLLRGLLLLLVVVFVVATTQQFPAFGYLVSLILPALVVAIPVVFQPELRRALERLGRAGTMIARPGELAEPVRLVGRLTRAVRVLAQRRHGALIVLEQETGLKDLIESGVMLDARLSDGLLTTIFQPGSTLHDGAVIIQEGRIAAAAVLLPISATAGRDRSLGTRHLAALGLAEATDAIVVVVSEETGTISLARQGQLIRGLDDVELSQLLHRWYAEPRLGVDQPTWIRRWPLARGSQARAPQAATQPSHPAGKTQPHPVAHAPAGSKPSAHGSAQDPVLTAKGQ